MYHDKVPVDTQGFYNHIEVLAHVLSLPFKQRTKFHVESLVPFVKTIPYFSEFNLAEAAISELLGVMTYREMKAGQLLMELGDFGDECFIVLDGSVEILHPCENLDEYNIVKTKMTTFMQAVD